MDNYYKKINTGKGQLGEIDLIIKKIEQEEDYFDDYTYSNNKIKTLNLYLYTFKNNKKIDSINIYMHKSSIWGNTDKIYYFNNEDIFILDLDTDIETGISLNSWKTYNIDENTGNLNLKDSLILIK